MKSLLFYFLQVVLCSAILYGYYHLALRNKKFHSYNRYYLLAAALISILLPLINIPIYFTGSHEYPSAIFQTLSTISYDNKVAPITSAPQTNSPIFTVEIISKFFYLLVASILLIRLSIAMNYIRTLLRKYVVEKIGLIYFINTEERGTPFSFFNWLFWNKKIDLQSENGEQIFRHEIFHIQQKHSVDIIFTETLTAIFWMNPFFHLIKKEVKAIHEFLADEFATREKDKWNYAELLLLQALGSSQYRLVNSFFCNQIKRRVTMITSSQKTSHQYLRKIMVLPLAAMVLAIFAFKYREIKNHLQINPRLPETTSPQGKKELSISDAANVADHGNKTISVTDVGIKDKNGKLMGTSDVSSMGMEFINKDTSKPLAEALIVIDGKEYPTKLPKAHLDSLINPNDIQSISVLKGSSAIEKYGEQGKNGVIEITTKENPHADTLKPIIPLPGIDIRANSVVIKDSGFKTQNSIITPDLIIFNNKEYSALDFYRVVVGYGRVEAKFGIIIPPDDLESIRKYGNRAKNGVIIFEEGKKVYVKPEIKSADLKKATLTSLLKLPPNIKVISCVFAIDTDKGTILESLNSGNDFSANTASLIQTAAPGKTLTIEAITIEKDGKSQRVPSIMYYIID